jgi:hypothetical protein
VRKVPALTAWWGSRVRRTQHPEDGTHFRTALLRAGEAEGVRMVVLDAETIPAIVDRRRVVILATP